MRTFFWLAALMFVFLPFEEEIKIGRNPLSKKELLDLLTNLRRSRGIGLFGILLGGLSDEGAREVVNDPNCRKDVAEFSAKDCYFLYFIQEGTNKTAYEQHALGVHKIAEWLEFDIKKMPCFLFFERPEYDNYIYIPLGQRSKKEILDEVKAIFATVREQKAIKTENFSPFMAIEKYHSTQRMQAKGLSFINFLANKGMEFAAMVIAQLQQP